MIEARQSAASASVERFVREIEHRLGEGPSQPAWLQQRRRLALAAFAAAGFPTTRHEEWRFTPVAPIAERAFIPGERLHVAAHELAPFRFEDAAAAELVFVNGVYAPALSTMTAAAGLEIGRLADLVAGGDGWAESHLALVADPSASPFTALNTAALEDGAFVRVRKGAVLASPVHVLCYSSVSGAPSVSHPRLLCVVEEHAELRIIETFAGPEGQVYLTNAVSEFVAGDGAVVDHYKVQRESTAAYHIASMQIRTGRQTAFTSHALTTGGSIARNDIGAVLGGEGGDTTLNGVYLATAEQLVDTHTTIDHALPHNGSHELYKGILGGRARAVFNGKIIVREDAQKTDAKQTNKALLLSDDAQINSKPQLEIFADDVKCTHGATVGQLDPNMLFYLRARGIGHDEARGLLIRGFVGDITNRIRIAPLRERLEEHIIARIPRSEAPRRADG